MANRRNVKDVDVDVDDIPDELDELSNSGVTNSRVNGETVTSKGLSLDELEEKGFDEARDAETYAKLNTPGGDWVKRDRWDFEQRVYANDTMPGDLDPSGRLYFIFKGVAEPRVVGGNVYTPNQSLRISPDIRFKPDNPDQIDMPHKLYMRAKDLYLSVRGEKCTPRKLVAFLEEEEYVVNTMPGNSGGSPYITDIKPIPQRKR